jgi:hypothetical protein
MSKLADKLDNLLDQLHEDELRDLAARMLCLESGGVDNWEWYSESLDHGGYYKWLEKIDGL